MYIIKIEQKNYQQKIWIHPKRKYQFVHILISTIDLKNIKIFNSESVKGGNKQKNIREIYLESINQYQGSKKGGKVTSKNISNIKKGESTPTGSSSYLENEYTLVKKILTATKALEKLKTSGVSTDKSNPKGEPQSNTAKSSAAAFKYKTQEEYYAEILEQKKLVKHLQNNEVISKAKLEYYDNELARKEQEILNLLDFKKDEASTSVRDESINLKIKAYKLEFSLKRKDAELTKLKSDLKTTDMKELKSQNERLRNELSKALMNDQKILEAQEVRGISFKDGKLVYQLEDQNDQTKSEVKQNIAKRLQKGQLYEANGPVIKLGDFKNKITLFGSLKDKLELLDERETELLVEISRLNKQIIRGKKNLDSRGSSRDKSPNDSSKMNVIFHFFYLFLIIYNYIYWLN